MKKITLIILLLLTSFLIHAQSPKIDSLKNRLAKLLPSGKSYADDTLRVKILCEMGFFYSFTNPDNGIKVSETALFISQKIKWDYGIARANHQIGYAQLLNGRDLKCIEYCFRSLKDAEKFKIDTLIGVDNRQIANGYVNLKKYELAESYYRKAMVYLLKVKQYRGYANCLNDIGNTYLKRKIYDKALKSFQDCIEFAKPRNISIMENYCTWNISRTLIEKKEYDKALVYANRGLELNKKIAGIIDYDWITGYNTISKIYFETNNLEKALFYAQKAETYVRNTPSNGYIELYNSLYLIHKKLGNVIKALAYHEKFIALSDSIKYQDFSTQLKNLQFEYENDKQKTKIELLDKDIIERKLNQKTLWFGACALLAIGIFLFLSNRILKNKNTLIEIQKNEILTIKSDLEDLNESLEIKVAERTSELSEANKTLIQKNQEIIEALFKGQTIERKRVASELHDNLGGTLSAIKWRLEGMNDAEMSSKEKMIYDGLLEMLQSAYAEVRLISHNMLPEELEKNGLEKSIRKLVNEINQGNRLEVLFSFKIDEKSLSNQLKLELYSICLELMNNVLKHAQAKEVVIHFYQREGKIFLQVVDDGIGISLDQKGNGMGMKNIQTRVDSLKGILKITTQEPTGTSVIISINS